LWMPVSLRATYSIEITPPKPWRSLARVDGGQKEIAEISQCFRVSASLNCTVFHLH